MKWTADSPDVHYGRVRPWPLSHVCGVCGGPTHGIAYAHAGLGVTICKFCFDEDQSARVRARQYWNLRTKGHLAWPGQSPMLRLLTWVAKGTRSTQQLRTEIRKEVVV